MGQFVEGPLPANSKDCGRTLQAATALGFFFAGKEKSREQGHSTIHLVERARNISKFYVITPSLGWGRRALKTQ